MPDLWSALFRAGTAVARWRERHASQPVVRQREPHHPTVTVLDWPDRCDLHGKQVVAEGSPWCGEDCYRAWETNRQPVRVQALDSARMWHNTPGGPRTPTDKAGAHMDGPWKPGRVA